MLTNVSRPSAVDVLRPFAVGDTFYADTTSTLAKRTAGSANDVYTVSGGVPVWSSSISLASLTVVDSGFSIVGSSDATKTIKFEVDAQTTGDDLTINSGAQTDDRTVTFPVLTGNAILAISNATLTNGRVPYAATNGILTDSANLTFSGTLLTIGASSGNSVAISSSAGASSNATGALTVTGGIGAQGNCYLGGVLVAGTRLGVGGAPAASTLFYIPPGAEAGVSGANQYGLAIGFAGSGTTRTVGFDSAVTTADSAITVADLVQFGAQTQIVKGSASTVTRQCSLFTRTQNAASTANIAWFHGSGNTLAGSGTWAMYNNTADPCLLGSGANIVVGSAALGTSATNGFLYVPTCAGTPTGAPTAFTGMAPIVIDSTNNKLYFYSGGAWRDAGP